MNTSTQPAASSSAAAATDVPQLIQELDGGQFERMLSVAISQAAAAAVDNAETAEVSIKLKLKPISGTHQVHCEHTITYRKPTLNGESSEKATQTTTLHVGKFGKLTITPENQLSFLDKQGNPT